MSSEFLLTEKYRPQVIDDCILPDETKKTFKEFVKKGEIPNLLLAGPPGIGKTTIATNLAVGIAKTGKSVLIIDTDTQGSAVSWRGCGGGGRTWTTSAWPMCSGSSRTRVILARCTSTRSRRQRDLWRRWHLCRCRSRWAGRLYLRWTSSALSSSRARRIIRHRPS